MVGDHAVQLAVARYEELEPDAEAVQQRRAGAEPPQPRDSAADAAQIVVVLAGLERDVIAEPPGLLVRVRVAADVGQQRGVVDGRPPAVVQIHQVG